LETCSIFPADGFVTADFPADGFVTATFFCVAASTVRLQATSFAYSAFWKRVRFFPPTVLLLLPIFPADGFVTATFFCVDASTVRLQATSFAYSAFWILI
jgi:hypothetical protein